MTFDAWVSELDRRHLASLTPPEVGRALRALSSCYVERRDRLEAGAALDGAGKRAAFALFYGVQHFLVTREIASRLFPTDRARRPGGRILDLGCGTGAAGAALALALGISRIAGYDVSRWAVAEANWTYQAFQLQGRASMANIRGVRIRPDSVVLAAYAVNELADAPRHDLLERCLDATQRGASVLVVEPIARRGNRWWSDWAAAVRSRGGREDDWRFDVAMPERQRALAKAAGLDIRELTARSLLL